MVLSFYAFILSLLKSEIYIFQGDCRESVTRNVSLWEEREGRSAPNLVIMDTLCPNECSKHGECNNGKLFHWWIVQMSIAKSFIFYFTVLSREATL